MLQLSSEEVTQLAPDAASVSAARGLAAPAKWVSLGQDEDAVWGECKGSGAKPYQVQVDAQGPAFKCSCPSRKFPCKHGLALLLMRAQDASRFTDARPAWVDEWLQGRRQRAEKAEAKRQAPPEAVADPQAAAKREAARLERMAAGLQDLERWMGDQLRQGLIQLGSQPEVWDVQARRLVDSQLSGLAEPLRRIGTLVGQDEDWPRRVLAEFGRLGLMVTAFAHRDQLPALVWEDLRTALGWPQEKTAALQGEQVDDDWLVLGEHCTENQDIWTRRLWLQGRGSGRVALLVDHAHGGRIFAESFVVGQCLRLRLGFYPSQAPQRAQLVERGPASIGVPPAAPDMARSLEALATDLAAQPWRRVHPLVLPQVQVVFHVEHWLALGDGVQWHLDLSRAQGFALLARSGGAPLTLVGEWNGQQLVPLSGWQDELIWTRSVE
jgi:hypothetical protein